MPCSIRYEFELTALAVLPIISDTAPASISSVYFCPVSASAELNNITTPISIEGIINIADV